MSREHAEKAMQFFRVICAFQHFGGKPLKTTDGAEALTAEELGQMEQGLRKLAAFYRSRFEQDADMQKLAERIEESLRPKWS
jgi:IS5 family transposase